MIKNRFRTFHPPVEVHQYLQQLSDLEATPDHPDEDHPHKRRQESLRLLLIVYDGASVFYAVLSIGSHLFDFSDATNSGKTADQTAQFEKIIFPSGVDGNIFGMGFCVSGSKLYLAGGQKSCDSYTEGVDCPPFPEYSPWDYSRSVFVVKFEDSQPLEVLELPAMESGKASPLVVEVEKTLYVLAGMPALMLPDPAFEAYNIIRKKWEGCDCPPFLQCNSKHRHPQFRSFVVIKKTIHVSTPISSFSYDTHTGKWSRCALFDDAPPGLRRYPHYLDWLNPLKSNQDEEQEDYGLPFSFVGGAVLYGEDVLIGVVACLGVFAYKLVDGKVKYYKSLEDLEIPGDSTSAYLADFKEGNLCLVFFLDPDEAIEEGKSAISIKPFHMFKPGYDQHPKDENAKILKWSDDHDHDKLNDKNWIYYKVGKTISPEFTQELANKLWNPLGCFAL